MRTLICMLFAGVSAHLAQGQIFRDNENKEFQFDEYKFPLFPLNPDFSEDSTWLKSEGRLPGLKRQRFELDKNQTQRNGYTRHDQIPDFSRKGAYFPFDNMPCLKPFGLFRMNVLEPDMSLYDMPVK